MPNQMKHCWWMSPVGTIIAVPDFTRGWVLMRKYQDTMAAYPFVFDNPPRDAAKRLRDELPRWFFGTLVFNPSPDNGIAIDVLSFRETESDYAPPHGRPSLAGGYSRVVKSISIPCSQEEALALPPHIPWQRPETINVFFQSLLDRGELTKVHVPEDQAVDWRPLIAEQERKRARAAARKPPGPGAFARRITKAAAEKFESVETFRAALGILAKLLQRIAAHHPEITDTDIRERAWDAVFQGFIYRIKGYEPPQGYNTDSADADAALRAVLCEFMRSGNRAADAEGLDTPERRHEAFQQNPSLELDEFFGWSESLPPPSGPIRGAADLGLKSSC